MSVVWTKEMAEAFLETEPDSLFPCCAERSLRDACQSQLAKRGGPRWNWNAYWTINYQNMVIENERDALGCCNLKCANCNCRMLFNKLECVKADLESTKETLKTTKETLNITSEYLDDTMIELGEMKYALKEEKKERNEDKRKFSIAIENTVEAVRLLWF